MTAYRLCIRISLKTPDHKDKCTANSKLEAAKKFLKNPALKHRGWTAEYLLPYISEEDSLNIQYGNDIE